ncbi:MAG: DUF5662 family protein [Nitrosarchaeum sp.]|nr:DUF5662 family protein [Nitrosarchaeum sp.]
MDDNVYTQTMGHIDVVRGLIKVVQQELMERSKRHDMSKLVAPEIEYFEKYTPLLKDSVYGSEEYDRFRAEMKPAMDHHYVENRHHPEHFKSGIEDMNLVDLIEMVCDWKAASMRHNDGDVYRSLDISCKRFGVSESVYKILRNTVDFLEGKK